MNVPCLKLFFILMLFVIETFSAEIADLRIVCNIDSKEITIKEIPNLCTALSLSVNSDSTLEAIAPLRKGLPLIYVYNSKSYDDMKKFIIPESADFPQLVDLVQKYKIEAVVFNNLYSPEAENSVDVDLDNQIASFFEKFKKQLPSVKIGVVVPSDEKTISHAFDVCVVDPHIDFYIVSTISYRDCESKQHQKDMINTSTKEDMEITIKKLIELKYDLKKVLLTIDLRAKNIKKELFVKYKDESSYTDAKLASTYQMLGLSLFSIEFDDTYGTCGCEDASHSTTYPIIKVLSEGLKGCPSAGVLGSCTTWNNVQRETPPIY